MENLQLPLLQVDGCAPRTHVSEMAGEVGARGGSSFQMGGEKSHEGKERGKKGEEERQKLGRAR